MPLSRTLHNVSGRLLRLPENQLFVLLLAFAAVLIFTGIGLRSPWPADEPRFAEVAREMVVSGQWLIPMRGGEYYPDKPPVFMWAIAFFYWLTGNLKLAFLLPNALCGLLTVALVFDLGRKLWNPRTGAVAVFLLLLAPQFLMQSKSAQIDAMVACWITVAGYGLLRHFFHQPAWGWYFAAWGFMGLGIITKGVGFLPALMLLPILALAVADRAGFAESLRWRCALGPVVMLLVVAAWLLPMVWAVDRLGTEAALVYRDNILFKQTGERYVNSWGHIKPWHYFFSSAIPSLWFPLPLLLLAAWRPWVQRLRAEPGLVVIFAWVALVVLFFSLSPGKRGVYLLPALPMFALGLAAMFDGRWPARWLEPLLSGLHLLLAGVLLTLGVLAWINHPWIAEKAGDYTRDPAHLYAIGSFLVAVGGVWLVTLSIFWHSRAIGRLFAAMMSSWMLFSTLGYLSIEPLRTPRNVLSAVEYMLPEEATLGLVDVREQLILFSKLDVTHFSYFTSNSEQERNAWLWMNEGKHRYLLVADNLELQCFDFHSARSVGIAHRRDWLLLGPEQRLPECEPPMKRQEFHSPVPGRWLDAH